MDQHLRNQACVVLIAGIIFFTNLGGPRLWDRDEPRNAGCAAEMLQRADWVVPVFNDQLRPHKPVLLYWLMMAAYSVLGINEFSARFWSAALSVGTVVLTYQIARQLFSDRVGLWSSCILASSLMFGVVARAATPDATFTFFVTAAIWVFVKATFPVPNSRRQRNLDDTGGENDGQTGRFPFPDSWPVAALMYALMGLAVLAKGPVGLVLPTAVIGMYCLLRRHPARDK